MASGHSGSYTIEQIEAETRSFLARVYGWMAAGLAVTGMVAYITANKFPALFARAPQAVLVLLIVEVLLVGALSGAIRRMSAATATGVFVIYAALNGVTLSYVFLLYTAESIASTFFVTGCTFGAMSVYGATTRRDLTTLGSLLFMALVGLLIATVVNIVLASPQLYWLTSYAGILIFVGLTAYDTQKIKAMNAIGNEGSEEDRKEAILGALVLYLDFVNLFVYLLRLLGRRR